MAKFEYEIVQHLGKLGESNNGWQIEVNIIKWNGNKPKLDIRRWNREKEQMGKGISLNDDEWGELLELLEEHR